MDINAEWSGRVYGARVFWNSSLFTLMGKGQFVRRVTIDINGVEIALGILEDPANPLLP